MVVYIYYLTAAGKSISSQLGSSCQGNRYGTEKVGGMARPSQITLVGSLSSSQQGGPPCWANPLSFVYSLIFLSFLEKISFGHPPLPPHLLPSFPSTITPLQSFLFLPQSFIPLLSIPNLSPSFYFLSLLSSVLPHLPCLYSPTSSHPFYNSLTPNHSFLLH